MFSKLSDILKSPILKKMVTIGELSFLFLGVLTAFLFYSHYDKILGNTASRFLLVIGPHIGIGRPYADLWEFVPPGFLTIANFWVVLFGWGMNSLKALQVVILTTIGVSFLLVIRKLFNSKILEAAIFSSFVLIFYSPILQSDMLSIELFGLTFALLGFLSLLYLKNTFKKLLFSSFLFLLASQMKETFTFSILALVPYYINILWKRGSLQTKFKYLIAGATGIFLAGLIIVVYLYAIDGLAGYKSVLDYKISRVQPFGTIGTILAKIKFVEQLFTENFLHWHHYLTNLLFLNLIIFYLRNQIVFKIRRFSKKSMEFLIKVNVFKKLLWIDWSGVFFSIGILIGIIMYGQYSIDTRQIPVAASFFILVGVLLKTPLNVINNYFVNKRVYFFINVLIAVFLIISLSPQKKIITAFFHQIRLHISTGLFGDKKSGNYFVKTSSTEINKYIAENSNLSDCILNPYGWEVAETYIYSGRKPCSRHFLANLVIQEKWQIEEYRDQIFKTPPKLIFYNVNIIDLNVDNFSNMVIDYPNVIKHCYSIDLKYQKYPYLISGSTVYIDLYWKKESLNESEFTSCFRNYGDPKMRKEI